MAITDQDVARAEARMEAIRRHGFAVAARFDKRSGRLVVELNTGVELAVPIRLVQEIAAAPADALSEIEITTTGLGLHWPKLDADVYVPGLMQGVFGSKQWMAQQLGSRGGAARTEAKAAAARENGLKGGRPKRDAA
jgi:hypothetical protein